MNFIFKNKLTEKFNFEKTEEESLLLSSPTLNPLEVRNIINMKNTLIKPYTQLGNNPDTSQYVGISDIDFKNIQSYLLNYFSEISHDNIKYKILPTEISPNIYMATTGNVAYLTPIELKGQLYLNEKLFGNISFMIILRGSTNSIYVPPDGVFLNNKKYKMYVENITIINVSKNNSMENKQKGFYAVANNLDMMIKDEEQDFNKTPQEIKLDRQEENPLTTFTELEDSEENFNLSEFIQDNEPEIEGQSITINY